MLAGLPLISLVLLFLIFWNPDEDWRSATLSSALVWGVLVTASTEILTLFRFLTFGSVLTWWLLAVIALGFIYYRLIRKKKRSLPLLTIPKISPVLLVLLGGVVFIAVTVGVIAVVAPPNNWDSMTYHMSRVVHWIQNHSVAHYPTYFLAQLFYPPFSGFAIMHLQILSGDDYMANLVQWLSMVGSILGMSLIAKQFGADGRGQIFAAVFCATIPMGILQASSTQNNYVTGFWIVCLAHYVLLVLPYKTFPTRLSLAIGASLGLAILTKSSGYIYAFPFMVWLFLSKLNPMGWKLWRPISVITIVFLSLNFSHYLRNIDLFDEPLGLAKFNVGYKMEIYSLPTFISNIIRNLSFHVDIVRALNLQDFITPITGKVAKLISLIHLGLGVDINDPRITAGVYRVPGISFDENIAGNPLHFGLILITIFVFIANKNIRKRLDIWGYLLALIGGFLLLCLLLKIQIYQSRHHLPIFVLFSAFVGLVFSQSWNRRAITFMAVILLVTAMPWVFGNKFRPIIGENNIFNTSRNELYFTNRPWLKDPYLKGIDFLKSQGCSNIGLSLGEKSVLSGEYWEYPFWPLLQKNNEQVVRLEHILHPENISNKKSKIPPHNNFTPCAIIAVRSSKEKPIEEMVIENGTYIRKWSVKPVSVLMKQ